MHSVGQAELAAFDAGSQWVTTDYKAGDLLVFSMHTMHGAVTNTATPQLRLSADIRFQPRSHAVDNRYTAHGPEWAVRTTRFPPCCPSPPKPTFNYRLCQDMLRTNRRKRGVLFAIAGDAVQRAAGFWGDVQPRELGGGEAHQDHGAGEREATPHQRVSFSLR